MNHETTTVYVAGSHFFVSSAPPELTLGECKGDKELKEGLDSRD
jgi:hypothetical protein